MTASRAALGATVAATAALLVLPPGEENDLSLPVLLVALAALAAFVLLERRRPTVRASVLVAAGAGLAALAVACPPHGSHDVWSYAMYGRIAGVHHANPYVVPPRAFPHDPFLGHVAVFWRGTRSVYGPLFTALSSAVAVVAGPSPTVARLLFQALAAAAFVAIVLLLARHRTPTHLLAAVALNPLLVVAAVNGGHNDLLVALAVVGAAIAARRDRPLAAGLLVAAGAAVKVTALLAAAALALWWHLRPGRPANRRAGVTVLLAAALPTVAATAAFGLRAPWRPLEAAARHVNGPTPWRLLPAMNPPPGQVHPHLLGTLADAVALAAAVAACVLVARRGGSPATAVAAAFAAYLLFTPYIMPWYLAWALPVAALGGEDAVVAVVAADAAVLLVAAQSRAVLHPDGLDRALGGFRVAAEVAAVLAAGALVAAARRPARPVSAS